MNQVPTKIVLKSTTRMSLNDRFSAIKPSVANIRANAYNEHQVSAANKRLAQQLANRPGLKASPDVFNQTRGNKRNLQQRLGGGRGNIKNRLGITPPQQKTRGGVSPGRGRGNNNSFRGASNFSARSRGTRGRGGPMRSRGRGTFSRPTNQGFSNRGKTRGARRGGRQFNTRGQTRGRGRGGRGGTKPPTQEQLDHQLDTYMSKTKSALDSDLDQYMSQV